MNLFIFGIGFSGLEIAKSALAAGAAAAAGTTRSSEKAAMLAGAGIEPFLFDGAALDQTLAARLSRVTHLVISIAPGAAGDPVLSALGGLSAMMPALEWTGYLSTVGVYGDHGGAWVDEETLCRPVSARSIERLRAEALWRAAAEAAGKPLAILRLSSIYGPGRNAFVNLEDGSAKRIIRPGQYFNRIHVADIAGAGMTLASKRTSGLFNVTDDEPAPPQDVVTYAAGLMGIEPPPEMPYAEAEMTPMARSFYGEVKRVSNAKIRAAGYNFVYPDYRTALDDMWHNRRWR